ncbi:MAG: universal stress protein [Haloarculaceae archaeon]
MYDRILVPTDGSEGSAAAIDHAIDLAKANDAALYALYVIETAAISPDVDAGTVLSSLERTGQRAIEDVRERAEAAGLERIEGSVAQGVPHRAILAYARDNDVDLIVMGTHGRTGIERYLLGSVAEKVVRLSEVPVLTVRLAAGETGENEA